MEDRQKIIEKLVKIKALAERVVPITPIRKSSA